MAAAPFGYAHALAHSHTETSAVCEIFHNINLINTLDNSIERVYNVLVMSEVSPNPPYKTEGRTGQDAIHLIGLGLARTLDRITIRVYNVLINQSFTFSGGFKWA